MVFHCNLHHLVKACGVAVCRCCSDSNSFFGGNCLDQTFIYNQAVGPVGFTADSLKAGAVPALKQTPTSTSKPA